MEMEYHNFNNETNKFIQVSKRNYFRKKKNNYYTLSFHKIIRFVALYLTEITYKEKNVREETPEIVEDNDEYEFE